MKIRLTKQQFIISSNTQYYDEIVDIIEQRVDNSIVLHTQYKIYKIFLNKRIDNDNLLFEISSVLAEVLYNFDSDIYFNKNMFYTYSYSCAGNVSLNINFEEGPGIKFYSKNKKFSDYYVHRLDGPAVIVYDKKTMKARNEHYFMHGKLMPRDIPKINERHKLKLHQSEIMKIALDYDREYAKLLNDKTK